MRSLVQRPRFAYGHPHSFNQQSFTKRQENFSFRVAHEMFHGRFSANAERDPSLYRQLPEAPQLTAC